MSDADGQQEPSMEEILASIRRIISEDGEGEGEAGAEAKPAAAPVEPDMPEPEPDLEEELIAEDLPEITLEDEVEPIPLSDDDDDVLELTEMVENDGTVVDLSQARGGFASSQSMPPDDLDDNLLGDMDGPMLSDHAAAAAAGSLAALTTAAGRKIADRLGTSDIGGLTLEALVRELLRPMMRDWLDQNLPPMVERMVRREIERVSKLQGR